MREYNYKDFFDITIKVANRNLNSISEEKRKKYHVFISDLSKDSTRRSVNLRYRQNLDRVNIKTFFSEDMKHMNFIKISSLCESILKYRVICFSGVKETPRDVMMLNYKTVLETALESVLMIVKEELGVEYLKEDDKLLYPTQDFEDYLLLSLIINDNSMNYNFDLLTFSLLLQFIFDYNVEKYKTE